MIKLTDWVAVIPPEDKTIAYVGEHESVTREFFLSDLSYRDNTFYLDMAFDLSTVTTVAKPRDIQTTQQTTTEIVNAEGTTVSSTANINKESYTSETVTVDCKAKTDIAPLAKLVQQDGIRLVWTVLSQQTQLPGLLRATLRAVGPNGEIKKSSMMLFTVAPSVGASPAAPIPLSEHEQMEQAMVQAFEHAARDKMDEMIDDAKLWADNIHGVYVGGGDMPAAAVIQIDPEGEAMTLDNVMSDTSESVAKTKVVKAYVDKVAMESTSYPGCFYRTVNGVTEWLNPPMMAGTEYRTAERNRGKPVYVQEFSVGALPNATYKTYNTYVGNVDRILSANLAVQEASSGRTYAYATTGVKCYVGEDAGNWMYISLDAADDASGENGFVTVKYTKTTD